MLYHPATLEHLLDHKKNNRSQPSPSLLALLVDHTFYIDINLLYSIIFSFTDTGNLDDLRSQIAASYRKVMADGVWVCCCTAVPDGVRDLVRQKKQGVVLGIGAKPRSNYVELLEEISLEDLVKLDGMNEVYRSGSCVRGRRGRRQSQATKKLALDWQPESECMIKTEDKGLLSALPTDLSVNKAKPCEAPPIQPSSDTIAAGVHSENDPYDPLSSQLNSDAMAMPRRGRKRQQPVPQANVLNFEKVVARPVEKIEKFAPLRPRGTTFIYDRSSIVFDTQRKRDDLVSPVKLQFIKHYDQRRPPIYRKKGRMARHPISYERLSEVISYDEDSSEEWECASEDPLECSSISESTMSSSVGGEQSEWIADDSTEEALEKRPGRKPTLIFDKAGIEVFCAEDAYLVAPLEEAEEAGPELLKVLEKARRSGESLDRLSELYCIKRSALEQILTEKSIE